MRVALRAWGSEMPRVLATRECWSTPDVFGKCGDHSAAALGYFPRNRPLAELWISVRINSASLLCLILVMHSSNLSKAN